jgi:HK97 family phage portal protein
MRLPQLFRPKAASPGDGAWLVKSIARIFGDGFIRSEGTLSGVPGLRGPAQDTNSVVAACLGYIVDTLPEAKLRIRESTGSTDETLAKHPLYAIIRRPNRSARYLWGDVVGAIGASLALDGNAYVRIRFDAYSQPESLEYVPHDCCEPMEAYTGSGLAYYMVNYGGKTDRVAPNEMLHFRVGIDSDNTLKGWSRFKSVQLSVLTDNEAEVYNRVMLRNLGVLGWIISPADEKTTITPEQADGIRERFLQQFSAEERGKPFVSSRGVKVEAAGHTPDKMMVREMRQTPEERICAVFRIPPIVAGVGAGLQRSTMANTKEQREQAVESCNCPMWAKIADVLTATFQDLGLLSDDQYFEFDLSTVRALAEDDDKRHARARENFKAGIWKRGESRSYTSKESSPDDEIYFTDLEAQASETAVLARENQKARDRAILFRALSEEL